jgi:phenylacetic acid degradation operon negative regulatory protein
MRPKKAANLTAWVESHLAANPPRSKSLVMTLFGDVIVPHGGEVWLGSLIDLLAVFGISDRLVRTSVFRLAEEGWLDSRREGRRSRYMLDTRSAARFKHAYQRIYTPVQRDWDQHWTLVFAIAGTITAEQRASLRSELLWQGYAMVAPFVFAHPTPDTDTLDDILQRVGVRDKVFISDMAELPAIKARPLGELVEQCWELGAVIASYQGFLADFGALPALLDSNATIPPELAFAVRELTIHAYRRIYLHDPELPLQLLPPQWPGKTASELCHTIYQKSYRSAEQFILDTLRKEDPAAPPVADVFYSRFGGLG